MPRSSRRNALLILALAGAAGGCQPVEVVREYFRDPTPHEAYALGLGHAGLTETALGQDWMRSAQEALLQPLIVEPPYLEEGYFPPEEATALGYRFPLRRGQRLAISVEVNGTPGATIFVDLFRAAPDSTRLPAPIMAGEAGTEMVFEARRTADYVLRVQPELLRGGQFRVRIVREPALEFPVAGRSNDAIQSFFGDVRDGGSRDHHGVDIFAPRGTPVVAAAEATVSRVDTTAIGGRVIWLRDEGRNASLYYAHLHEPLVTAGTRVSPGDTIGLVGNTGNARTTPPHLHFGIYVRREGPVDPFHFIAKLPTEPRAVEVEVAELGSWVRTRDGGANVLDRPSSRGQVMARLPLHTAVRVMGGVGGWYRVSLPDGSRGFVTGRSTEAVDTPLWRERVVDDRPLQARPVPGSPVMERFEAASELPVLGTFGGFLYVLGPHGRAGWVAVEAEEYP